MADLKTNLKSLWMKGMEAVGNTASSIASNTRYKVEEMNLLNRRREILTDFGAKAYALWQKGECEGFPEELQKDLRELTLLDNQLVDMRAEHFAGQDGEETSGTQQDKSCEDPDKEETENSASEPEALPESEEEPSCETEETSADQDIIPETKQAEPAEEPAPSQEDDIRVSDPSIRKEITDLFDEVPAVEAMAEKIHDTLDQMESSMKKFEAGQDNGLKNP